MIAARPIGGRRRRTLAGICSLPALLVAIGGSTLGESVAGGANGVERPNIIVVMTDDQRADDLFVMKRTRRQLLKRGTTFENSFATMPVCCPSRASLLTGQYAHNHGVTSNLAVTGGGFLGFQDEGALPQALQQAGFRTAWIGKYLNGYEDRARKKPSFKPAGWSKWFASIKSKMYDWVLNRNGRLQRFKRRTSDYQTDVLARIASRFIRTSATRDKPFFMTVAPLAPHGESDRQGMRNPRPARRHRGALQGLTWDAPPSFNEEDLSDKPSFLQKAPLSPEAAGRFATIRRNRLESLLAVDDLIGGLFAALRETGELDRTYVVFTSDNGLLLGEHRRGGKRVLFEETARVPLVVRGPGVPAGVSREQLAANIDIAPTLLDAAGVEPLRAPDGASLLPLAADPGVAANRELLLSHNSAAIRGATFPEPWNTEALRTPGHVYAEHAVGDGREYELYDVGPDSPGYDPFQLENLLDPQTGKPRVEGDQQAIRDLRDTLAGRLAALRGCAGDECRGG